MHKKVFLMIFDAFTAKGRFWRGNIHGHSNLSDGRLSVEEVCLQYREAGYDFISVTDHFLKEYDFPLTDARAFERAGFTTIRGAELHAPQNSRGEWWHIVAVGLPEDFAPLKEGETGAEIARRAREAGAFMQIPHPQWSQLTSDDIAAIDAAHAVELYNHASATNVGRGDGEVAYDTALSAGFKLGAVATDDSHFVNDDAFGGWVMVKAEENTPEALVEAMKAGHYYATQGPQLHDIRRDGDELVISCSPAQTVTLMGEKCTTVQVHGLGMTQARVSLKRFVGGWCRIVVRDQRGRSAWSNPYWPTA